MNPFWRAYFSNGWCNHQLGGVSNDETWTIYFLWCFEGAGKNSNPWTVSSSINCWVFWKLQIGDLIGEEHLFHSHVMVQENQSEDVWNILRFKPDTNLSLGPAIFEPLGCSPKIGVSIGTPETQKTEILLCTEVLLCVRNHQGCCFVPSIAVAQKKASPHFRLGDPYKVAIVTAKEGIPKNIYIYLKVYMGVSKNRGTPKSSILLGFSMKWTIHFGGFPPIFGNAHILGNPTSIFMVIPSDQPWGW